MDPAHYKIILSYNGSAFAGFQRQQNARTVQGEIETGLRKMGWHGQSILGAGRTDAGVHARAQVVSFHLEWEHSLDDLRNALNYYLPNDMAVQSAVKVTEDFHPRYDAKSRRYRYTIFCSPVRDPLREGFAWRVWPEVNYERMVTAANFLIGVHDFKAFGSPTSENGTTVREVFFTRWQRNGEEYQFDITANAFLYHMVRRITFVLVNIGQDKTLVGTVGTSLATGEMTLTGLAPAEGLVLEEVIY
jgi:tRNA pseudouridine38-40 synthase